MQRAIEALETLKKGNGRYVANGRETDDTASRPDGHEYMPSQRPSAIIVGCSDSRVPVELVFDQGFGSLFVIRVAGNVVTPPQVGSVEFAVQQFETPLVVVLGHSNCGAVAATVDELASPEGALTPNLQSIVDQISPAVQTLMETPLGEDRASLIEQAVRANVRLAADQLRQGSSLLQERIASEKLLVIGAEYSLETGVVDFFDGVPA